MVGNGYYVWEYNYRDKRGHILTKREMRGTFGLTIKVYKDIKDKIKNKDPKAPIRKPRLLQCQNGIETEIDFKKELEEWRSLKSNIKK